MPNPNLSFSDWCDMQEAALDTALDKLTQNRDGVSMMELEYTLGKLMRLIDESRELNEETRATIAYRQRLELLTEYLQILIRLHCLKELVNQGNQKESLLIDIYANLHRVVESVSDQSHRQVFFQLIDLAFCNMPTQSSGERPWLSERRERARICKSAPLVPERFGYVPSREGDFFIYEPGDEMLTILNPVSSPNTAYTLTRYTWPGMAMLLVGGIGSILGLPLMPFVLCPMAVGATLMLKGMLVAARTNYQVHQAESEARRKAVISREALISDSENNFRSSHARARTSMQSSRRPDNQSGAKKAAYAERPKTKKHNMAELRQSVASVNFGFSNKAPSVGDEYASLLSEDSESNVSPLGEAIVVSEKSRIQYSELPADRPAASSEKSRIQYSALPSDLEADSERQAKSSETSQGENIAGSVSFGFSEFSDASEHKIDAESERDNYAQQRFQRR